MLTIYTSDSPTCAGVWVLKVLGFRLLGGINIFAQNTGKNVPLIQVANIVPEWQYAKIKRRNLYRTMTVSCDAASDFTANEITNILSPALTEMSATWKPGYTYNLGGESEQSGDAMGAVGAKLPLAGFIIILLLLIALIVLERLLLF